MDELNLKKQKLEEILKELGSVAIAYSSGVDSTFLLKTAHDILGDKAIAVTVRSCLMPKNEISEAEAFCKKEGIRHIIVDFDPFSVDGFSKNPENRCYICKRSLLSDVKKIAEENGAKYVCEGSNTDDEGDYRPGKKAVLELGVKSPLLEAGLTKNDIRILSREKGLKTWNKPSFACLASRFVYGETITKDGLSRVEKAEKLLFDLGFEQYRVRVHGNIARIEVEKDSFEKLIDNADNINTYLKELGFLYITLDLGGYRTGSMNSFLENK